jgi:5-methyltetrahydrofolate--homocysteine methyltransferase
VAEARSPSISLDVPIPAVPDLDLHIEEAASLNEVWGYVNLQVLFNKYFGFKGNFEAELVRGDPKAARLWEDMERVKAECRAGLMHVRVLWRFFEAESEGNAIHLFEGRGSRDPAHTFRFPRQRAGDRLCLSDLVLPSRDGRRDHIALFVTGAGEGIQERAEAAKARGEYFRSVALQALAVETAEAAAEWLHRRLRELWGFPDPPETAMADRFRARYRGKRYSFGYPACPNLEDQAGLFKLMRPERIGVSLTEGFMMEPEASVSALVFHHPDARYFTAP